MDAAAFIASSIDYLSESIKNKEITSRQLTEALIERIREKDGLLNSFITVYERTALKEAKKADEKIKEGKYIGRLHGIPIGLKDLFETKDSRTTYGSKIFKNHISRDDASVVKKLRDSGAVIIGKLNLHEFAYGAFSENPFFGAVRNPWNLLRISGGSSGGSAAAVAASFCYGSLGSDTGGSIRMPASLCGVVGFKPTYGVIDRRGMFPLSWSQDTVGIITKKVRDAALLFGAIAEQGPSKSTSSSRKHDLNTQGSRKRKKFRIGVLTNDLKHSVDEQVRKKFLQAAEMFREVAVVSHVFYPMMECARAVNSIVMASEAYSYHERNLKLRYSEYGTDVRARLLVGSLFLASDYIKALRLREQVRQDLLKLFQRFDFLLSPTTPIVATEIGNPVVILSGKEVNRNQLLPIFTRLFSTTGFPCISIPCGFSEEGLPIGLQISASPYSDNRLFDIGTFFEKHYGLGRRGPPNFSWS